MIAMEPLTTVTGVLTIAKSAAEISKKLDELWKAAKDRETKQQIEVLLDKMHDLKQAASALEDENRELRNRLRFKGEDYEFRNPFYYPKDNQERPLCPKCFSDNVAAPMSERWHEEGSGTYRECLVCKKVVLENRALLNLYD